MLAVFQSDHPGCPDCGAPLIRKTPNGRSGPEFRCIICDRDIDNAADNASESCQPLDVILHETPEVKR